MTFKKAKPVAGRKCWCLDDKGAEAEVCIKPDMPECPRRPGRPEFITFDTEFGLALVFTENLSCVAPIPDQGAYGGEESHERHFALHFSQKSGGPSPVMGGLTLMESRLMVSQIAIMFRSGPMIRGTQIDLNNLLAFIQEKLQRRAEMMAGPTPVPDEPSPIINPVTDQPVTQEDLQVVGATVEGVGATT